MRNNMKRILSLILCITMLMGVMPTSAFATEMVDPSGMVSVQEYTDSGPVPEEDQYRLNYILNLHKICLMLHDLMKQVFLYLSFPERVDNYCNHNL